jgi:hypothetical protein
MSPKEQLIQFILNATPEQIEYLADLMLKQEINPADVTKPSTVRQ